MPADLAGIINSAVIPGICLTFLLAGTIFSYRVDELF